MAADFLRGHGVDLQREIDKTIFDSTMTHTPASSSDKKRSITAIEDIRLSDKATDSRWDITLKDGKIESVDPSKLRNGELVDFSNASADSNVLDGRSQLLLPSLCHPHIHLDKCFLLSHPKYDDLDIVKGDFTEALELTSKAKGKFEEDDLITRGKWLVQESIAAGVTHMRVFVEVDTTVRFKCLDAGLKLKAKYVSNCEIQICVFAQDPVFSSGNNHPEGKALIEEALSREGVDALGSTPYVEESEDLMRANVDWAVTTAVNSGKHLDFHLDYNLDGAKPPLIHYVLDRLHEEWSANDQGNTIVLGHCTRLTLFNADEWRHLKTRIADLPIHFVGLPTSDLFMMGKPTEDDGGGQRVRGTLQVPQMIQKYGLKGAIGVNNVGNAFTPQGNCDPMSIASMGVGVYQAGTKADTQILYDCVSSGAKAAIGFSQPDSPFEKGAPADFILFHNQKVEKKDGADNRSRKTLQEVIYDPPSERRTVKGGCLCP